jgi:hypothetical protein
MSFNREFMDGASLLNIERNPYELLRYKLDLWDRQNNLIESFKSNGEMIAVTLWASNSALELSMHQVNYD